ncbi:hypothetical protein ACFOEY_11795 [Paracandidimonas soli]
MELENLREKMPACAGHAAIMPHGEAPEWTACGRHARQSGGHQAQSAL